MWCYDGPWMHRGISIYHIMRIHSHCVIHMVCIPMICIAWIHIGNTSNTWYHDSVDDVMMDGWSMDPRIYTHNENTFSLCNTHGLYTYVIIAWIHIGITWYILIPWFHRTVRWIHHRSMQYRMVCIACIQHVHTCMHGWLYTFHHIMLHILYTVWYGIWSNTVCLHTWNVGIPPC